MKKKWAIVLAMASLFALSACAKNEQQGATAKDKKITFVLDWTPNTNHTGLYVAKEKGYFKEEGLDVDIVQPSDGDAATIVASGKAQFGISAQDSIAANYASKEPLPVTNVAAILQHNTSGIISRKGEGMERPKGLENKTYATWDSPVEKAMIKNVMEKDGGQYDKLKMIPNNIVDEPKALKEKQTDAIWVFYGWGGIAAGLEKVPVDYFYFKEINPVFDYYTPTIIANDKFLKEDKETAKKFMKAVSKGYEFAIKSPDEAAAILIKSAPELDKDLVKESQRWISKQYQAEAPKWGYIDEKRWNNFYNWLGENKLINKALPKNTGFTNDYLPK